MAKKESKEVRTALAAIGVADLDGARTYIRSRVRELKSLHSERDTRMDNYEKLAKLDVWQTEMQEGEKRLACPRAWTTIDGYRTLMFTRPPKISVPPSNVTQVEEEQAASMEKYLYGTWRAMRLIQVIHDAEHLACALSEGVIRLVYDPGLDGLGEFPLVAQHLDPRNVYYREDRKRTGRLVEVAHCIKVKRRDVEQEHGLLPNRPKGATELQKWLETKVEYTDYWLEVIQDGGERKARKAEPTGPMQEVAQERTESKRKKGPRPQAKTRRLFNAITITSGDSKDLADDIGKTQFLKEPQFQLGYEGVPFHMWGGITTGFGGRDRHVSVLYALAGGENLGKGTASGILAVENDLMTMQLEVLRRHANNVWLMNDPDLAKTGLDMTPDAVNEIKSTSPFAIPVVPSATPPQLDAFLNRIQEHAEAASLSRALQGAYIGDVSGIYVSMITNPVLMKIARMQQERQAVLEEINEAILALTEFWAPDEGWPVYYKGPTDKLPREIVLQPDHIGGYRRNHVKLSAMLPRDAAAEGIAIARYVDSDMLSRHSAIERLQEMGDFELDSAEDEIMRIMRERSLLKDETMSYLYSQIALRKYSEELAAMREQMQAQGQGQPGPQGPPQYPGAMQGIPPELVPPEQLPPMIAQEGQQGAMETWQSFIGNLGTLGGPT